MAPPAPPGPVVDLIVPELHAHEGGVQIYSRTMIRGLLQVLPPSVHLRVFVRNDRPRHRPARLDPRVELHLLGSPLPGVPFLRFTAALLAAAGRQRPALVISTHPNLAPLQWLLGRLAGCPTWASAHGIDVWNLRPGPRRWALRRLTRLLPVSRYTKHQLQRQLKSPLGRRGPELVVLPNTYDDRSFCPGPRPAHLLERYGLDPDQPLIFCLTRLSSLDRYKHVDGLITAMPELLRSRPDLRLLIGGEGDDRARLQALVQERGLGAAVQLIGNIGADDLPDHYRLASLFALPSEKEGFGIVFLEAVGSGTPVLAGNRDGSVDPLADGAFGCLVDPRLPLAPPLQALLEGYGEPLWHQREALAAAVAERFGFRAFCGRLRRLLADVPALVGET
ncbi:glycosyltransferase [Cyanobium sp. Morenito 9A2]|uniref:glycosyltransferase n=1 Tax=Cyanobium sp. Morenito 9A2 TaxID=2823718 RepID=UPI0020CBEAE9|nr:glycosyltransferase [Cyanobium sp. Morenito 9A2]MCP9849793.1 glycosyltransferase [Cyanobium sp. Morenito 9A2]